MEIDSPEEFSGSNDHHSKIIKRKRTKRQRPSSPFGMAVTSSSSSGGGGSSGGGSGGGGVYFSIPSPTTSSEIYASTEEDEDMANCLILLARGGCPRQMEEDIKKVEKFTSRRKLAEMPTTTTTKAGFYVYECKTCNRTFPSFQALGGHRASHKKPKAMTEERKFLTLPLNEEEEPQLVNKTSPPLSLSVQPPNNILHSNYHKAKVHECSICGSEFSSGQALGGHMRRHRTQTSTRITASDVDTGTIESSSHDGEKPRFILPLDLNLPAPEDDDHCDSKFQFIPNQPHLVFSAPALVGCHY